MKYYALIVSTIIPAFSYAMEQEIEIRNRDLHTLQKPHIIIINKLPRDAGFSPRIDVSDQPKNYYRSDESNKTIWPGQGIRFSPNFNRNGLPEHKRLGMNDAGKAALIALYIHGTKYSLQHILIGEDTQIKFGDTITITVNNDKIVAELPDNTLLDLEASLSPSVKDDYLVFLTQPRIIYLPKSFLTGKAVNYKYAHGLLTEWNMAMNDSDDFFEYIPGRDDALENSSSEIYEFSEYTDSFSYESSEYSDSSSSKSYKTPEYSGSSLSEGYTASEHSSSSSENYETSESSK